MILAGTSKGVFQISEDGHQCTLDRDGIREVVVIRERLFAGSISDSVLTTAAQP